MPRIGPHEPKPVSMQIEPTRNQILAANSLAAVAQPSVPRSPVPRAIPPGPAALFRRADPPVLPVDLHQLTRARQPAQLLAQLAPLLAAAEPQLANQLLVSGAPLRQPLNVAQQFAIVHAGSMVRGPATGYWLPPTGYGLFSHLVAITWIL